jgi:LuxR family transcriptional regulator, maltose regulon positive regulatory protein
VFPPARPVGLVSRPRLVRRLTEARETPLALVVAPAGYGKTTLLTEWAAHDSRPFAWIRADAGTAAGTLAERLEVERITHPTVLVLDEAHRLAGADVLAILGAAAEAMPPGSQLVLSARGGPELSVGRLRAHRRLLELRTEDLAMETAEAAALLERVDLRLPDEDVDTLVRRTEGWPAGLYLAALSVRAQPNAHAAVQAFAGDDRLVAEYLRDELLAPLSATQTDFLVRTSVLGTLSAAACDAVLDGDGSAAALAELARSGAMLISTDRSGASYRQHRLFGELLRAELRRTEPELEPELHRRASAWHVTRGHSRDAIRHAVAAGDIDAAAALVWSDAPARIAQGDNEEVRRWIAEFTPEQIGGRARLTLAAAAAALAAGDGEQVERWTVAAAGCMEGRRSGVTRQMRDALAILQASLGREGLARMGAQAARATHSTLDGSLWPATARLLEGVGRHLTGRPGEARAPLEEAGRGGGSAAPSVQVLCLAQLGLLALDEGNPDEAAVLAGRARSQVSASGLDGCPTAALVFALSALVRAQRGLGEEARGDLHRSRRLLGALVDFMPWYEIETRIVLARAALCLGDLGAARALAAEASGRLREAPDATRLRAWIEETRAEVEAATLSAGEGCALTKAEARVLQLLPTHLSVPAIADRLYVSPNTVKTHVRAVYRKLDASSRAEAVAHASAAGLLDDAQAA